LLEISLEGFFGNWAFKGPAKTLFNRKPNPKGPTLKGTFNPKAPNLNLKNWENKPLKGKKFFPNLNGKSPLTRKLKVFLRT